MVFNLNLFPVAVGAGVGAGGAGGQLQRGYWFVLLSKQLVSVTDESPGDPVHPPQFLFI